MLGCLTPLIAYAVLRYLGRFSIADAAGLKSRLQEIIEVHPGRIIIDLDAVISADTAGLQLLTAFVTTATRNGSRVQWDNLSVPLYMAACQLNLEEQLQF